MMAECKTCTKEISAKTTSGLCKTCYAKTHRLQNPERQKDIAKTAYQKRTKNKIKHSKRPIEIAEMYNYWRVLAKSSGRGEWLCLCTGCAITQRKIKSYRLRLNKTSCCGCLKLHKLTIKTTYGVDNVSQLDLVKQKKKETLYRNFGTQGASHPSIIEKREKTNLIKYGTTNPLQNSIVKEKGRLTNISKYGAENHNQMLSRRKTNGTVLSTGEVLTILCDEYAAPKSSGIKIYNDYGEEAFLKWCKSYNNARIYSTEACFASLMQSHFPNLKRFDRQPVEFKLNRRPDFRIELDDKVLYVNTDGLYDHMQGGRRDLDNSYHLDLAKAFQENGQTIFQFRSDELKARPDIIRSIVLNYLNIHTSKYNARQLMIKKVPNKEAHSFFHKNHLMGAYSSTQAYGLWSKETNELVSCMSIRNTKQGLEIARFASLLNVSVRGGFSKLLTYISHLHKPNKIISFCDLRYSTGKSYDKLGFTLESKTLGWKWTDCHYTYNRLQCKAKMDDRGLSQAQYAKELKWYKIYDAGQAKYVKECYGWSIDNKVIDIQKKSGDSAQEQDNEIQQIPHNQNGSDKPS